jgi:Sec-independent protein translocase protein TatA
MRRSPRDRLAAMPTWLIVFLAAALLFGALRLWRGAGDE